VEGICCDCGMGEEGRGDGMAVISQKQSADEVVEGLNILPEDLFRSMHQ
jgi:hypothetical protein